MKCNKIHFRYKSQQSKWVAPKWVCLIGWTCCTTANKNWKHMGKKNGKYCNKNLPGERLNNNLFSFYFWLHYFHYSIQSWCRFWRRHFLNVEGTHYVFSQPGNYPETFFLVWHYWLTKFTNVDNNVNNISMLLQNKPKRTWFSTG